MGYLRSFWSVGTPTSDSHIANKGYVDSAVAAGIAAVLVGGPGGLGGGLLRGHTPTVISHTASGPVAIDYATNSVFRIEATADVTGFSFSNIPNGVTDVVIQVENVGSVDIEVDFGTTTSTILEDELSTAVTLAPGASMDVGGREWWL